MPTEDLYIELQQEIERACQEAFGKNSEPTPVFDEERWSEISSPEELLATTKHCIDARIDATTTSIDGRVSFLVTVSFAGSIDGEAPFELPTNGSPCSGSDGYSDLAAGGTVIIADSTGRALATVPLGAGSAERTIKNTKSERTEREDLIDAIYGLRVAKANGDPVLVAQHNLERAELRLYDLDHPGATPPPFEGHAFEAVWCNLPFAASRLPKSPSYTVTVTHRGTTTHPAEQIEANDDRIDLVIG